MGNTITNCRVDPKSEFYMSNMLTTEFLEVLVIAGSDLASTDWERALVRWLAEHDQTLQGLGIVGFDVADLGWSEPGFVDKRRFVLELIDAALARRGWERLGYEPHEKNVLHALRQFRAMVSAITEPVRPTDHRVPEKQPPGMCSKHQVYRHGSGCIICRGRGA